MARKSRKLSGTAELHVSKPCVAYGYSRISADSDHAEDSIDNQTAIIREYFSGKPEFELCGFRSDVGYSGTNFNRPGYAELMELIKIGEVGCVAVKDLSRLGRTYIEVGELLFDTFPAHGVRFISVNDGYDSFADDAGKKKLLLLFKNLINHMYSLDLSKKARSTMAMKIQRGEPIGLPPYGYAVSPDGKRFEVDEETAEVVKLIFELKLSGKGSQSIARHLTQLGIPTPKHRMYLLGQSKAESYSRNKPWDMSAISKMLRNEAYTGTLVLNKRGKDGSRDIPMPESEWIRHYDAHPAIIDRESFDEVQRLNAEVNAKLNANPHKPLPENRYAGVLFCSRCGKRAVAFNCGSLHNTLYYGCRDCDGAIKSELGLAKTSKLPSSRLDEALSALLKTHISVLVDLDALLGSITNSEQFRAKQSALTREKQKLEKAAASSGKTLSAAYTHHLDGLLDFREYELIRDKAERDKREAESRFTYIDGELKRLGSLRDSAWVKELGTFRNFESLTKTLIQTLVKAIYITPVTNEFTIELNYADSFAELREAALESGVSLGV